MGGNQMNFADKIVKIKIKDIFVEKRGENYLFLNKQNGAWIILKDSETLYNLLNSKDETDIEVALDTREYEKLKVLIDNKIIGERDDVIIEQPYKNKFNLLILDTTDKCNLNCKYCSVNASTNGNFMKLDTAIRAFEIFTSLSNCSDKITVEFSGGEPLLNFKLIKQSVPEFNKIAQNKGIQVSYSIQSNGILLDEEIIDFLKENNFSIGISLDGSREVNDSNRIFPDNTGSFDKVMKAIKKLKNKEVNFSILAVISDPSQYSNLLNFAVENGIKSIRANYLTQIGRARKIFKDTTNISQFPIEYAKAYLEMCKKLINEGVKIKEANLTYLLWNLLLWQPHMCFRIPCGAGNNQLHVTATGDIYPCQDWRSIHDIKIANVQDSDIEEKIMNHPRVRELRQRNLDIIKECQNCNWKRFCGTCPREIYTEKKQLSGDISLCKFYGYLFNELIWIIYHNKDNVIKYLLEK